MINKQTTLDLNGPILSIVTNPLAVSVGCSTSGIATFVGLATALFPTQTPSNPARPTGSISYQWYLESYGALTDGTITELGITAAGSATTTLTLSNLYTAGIGTLSYVTNPNIRTTNVYFTADYVPSAYGQDPITVGTARSTGNSINEPITSSNALLTVNPNITISNYPEIATVSPRSNAGFDITASTTELDSSALTYQWYANGVSLIDGSNTVVVQSPNQTITTTAPGFNGSGIYLDLTDLSGNVYARISTSEESGIFHYINIPGIGNIPENYGSQVVTLAGGRIYGPCSAPYGGLYIGNETPVGGTSTLVVEEGGDDWNDMILSINQGYFRRLTSAPTVSVPGTGPVSATDTVTGSTSPNLVISSNTVGIQTIQCKVSHPTACNSPLYSNVVDLNVIDANQRMNIELLPDGGGSATLYSWNLLDQGSFSVGPSEIPAGSSMCFYAPEKDINVFIDLYANAGANNGGYSGGQGGVSTIKLPLKRNQEYMIMSLSQANNGSSVFLYRKSRLIAAVGGGGNAGSGGNGGNGGGVNVAGADGTGRGAGTGGQLYSPGTLPSTGIFGSTLTDVPTKSGDGQASAPSGGRVLPCPRGDYWYDRGYSACQDMGNVQFYTASSGVISNSTSSITRGFKAGYGIRNTAGAGVSGGGNGGNGATGGNGGNGGGGGGGGSGYCDGSITIVSTQQGGNTGGARVIIRSAD